MIMNYQKLGKEKGRPLLDALWNELVGCCVRLVPNPDADIRRGVLLPFFQFFSGRSKNETAVATPRPCSRRLVQLSHGCWSVAPPLHEHRDALGGDGDGQLEKVALRTIGLLAQHLAAQECLEHPQKVTNRVELCHDNLQFDWFRFSLRDSTMLATISKKIASIVLEIVANTQQTRYQGTALGSNATIAYSTTPVKPKTRVRNRPILRPFWTISWIKNSSFLLLQNMVRADVFNGFFCGFDSCGSAAFPDFRGGTSSPPQAAKAVRTNSSILHHVGKVNASPRLGRGSATKSYGFFGAKRNSRFR